MFLKVFLMEKHASFWHSQTLQENKISKSAKKVNVAVFFQYFSGRCRILTAHSIRLSLIRNSRVAGFQGRVACRSYPLEGLFVRLTIRWEAKPIQNTLNQFTIR